MFENHVVVNGKRTSRRALLALAKLCRRENQLCVAAEAAEILEDERVSFFSHVLSALHSRGRSVNRCGHGVFQLAECVSCAANLRPGAGDVHELGR